MANLTLNPNISAPLRFATASKTTMRGTVAIKWYLPPSPPPHGSCFADLPSPAKTDCGTGGCTATVLQCPNALLNPIVGFEIASFGNGTGASEEPVIAPVTAKVCCFQAGFV